MADFDDESSDASLTPGRHEHGAARHTGPTPTYSGETPTSGTQSGSPQRHRSRRRRWLWIAIPIAAVLIAAIALTPTILNWISISVEDEDRQISLGGDGSVNINVPAGWVLEQRPFASEAVLHTPDGAIAMCLSVPDAQETPLTDRLTEAQGWSEVTFSVEQSPSGATVHHAVQLPTAAAISDESGSNAPEGTGTAEVTDSADTEHPCGNLPVTMLAVVDPGPDSSEQLVAVRVGSTGDITPYLGEIADILEGVTAA